MTYQEKNINPWSPERWAVTGSQPLQTLPLVTIGILNYNRCDELQRTLDCATRAIDYPLIEFIVVDNASSDGSIEMVNKKFPNVRVIEMPTNIGTAARNEFYREARGKYIFSYDDDSFPATPATIFNVIQMLEERPEIDIVSFYCYQPLTFFVESGGLEQFSFLGNSRSGYEGLFFVEGGMCVRQDSFKRISGYDNDFFWGAEGADLTLQCYKLGMKTLYYPACATLHMKSQQNRNTVRNVKFFTRNYIWIIGKHFPILAAIPLMTLYIMRRVIAIVLHPSFASGYVQGILEGIAGLQKQFRKNDKLSLRQVFGLKRWYLFLLRW